MKRITLVKICEDQSIGHLYEHVYCRALNNYLRQRSLMTYVDYHYDAKTYPDFVHLNFFLFTPEAENSALGLFRIEPDFSEEEVQNSLYEIMAEKQSIAEVDMQKSVDKLKQLHGMDWRRIENLSAVNLRFQEEQPQLVSLTMAPGKFHDVSISLRLDENSIHARAELLPIFRIISTAILNNITSMLADEYSYFSHQSVAEYDQEHVAEVRNMRVYKKPDDEFIEELHDSRKLLNNMFAHKFIEKVHTYLTGADYSQSLQAPDELEMYEVTGYLMGGIGWKETTSKECIKRVLASTVLELEFMSKKKILALKECM